jgi:hypothetical protein
MAMISWSLVLLTVSLSPAIDTFGLTHFSGVVRARLSGAFEWRLKASKLPFMEYPPRYINMIACKNLRLKTGRFTLSILLERVNLAQQGAKSNCPCRGIAILLII